MACSDHRYRPGAAIDSDYTLRDMTLLLPLSDSALLAMAEAIFSKSPVAVVESDSFDSAPRTFTTVAEFCDYAAAQKAAACGSVHLAVLYPDMGGRLAETRRNFAPENSSGFSYGVSVEGWGLIRVHSTAPMNIATVSE
jgi:hypothetical protein